MLHYNFLLLLLLTLFLSGLDICGFLVCKVGEAICFSSQNYFEPTKILLNRKDDIEHFDGTSRWQQNLAIVILIRKADVFGFSIRKLKTSKTFT